MVNFAVPDALSPEFVPPKHWPHFNATPTSWYCVKRDAETKSISCSQDRDELLYLHLPNDPKSVSFDLNWSHPEDSFNLDAYEKGRGFDDFLSWIKSSDEVSLKNTDFVFSEKYVLTDLMLMPYSMRYPYPCSLNIHIAKVGNKIFLMDGGAIDSSKASNFGKTQSEKDICDQRTKQGMKFQHHLLSNSPSDYPDPSKPYRQWEKKLFVMMDIGFGGHKIMCPSKIKCLESPEDLLDLENAKFTDLRTNNGTSINNIKWYKWINFWANNVVGKISKVVVGYVKNVNEGIVRRLDVIDGRCMMNKCQIAYSKTNRNDSQAPSAAACFDYLNKILQFIKTVLRDAGPDDIYRLRWDSSSTHVSLEKLKEKSEEIEVVPGWFKVWVEESAQ